MIKVLAVLILLYVGYRIVMMFRRENSRDVKNYRVHGAQPNGEDLVQDPFCRTYVPKSQAYIKMIDGRQQYFCSSECCDKYLAEKK